MKRATHLLILLGVGLGGFWLWHSSPPRTHGRFPHEVYLWQRAWTPPVRAALSQPATNFAALVALKAEISWQNSTNPRLTRVSVDYDLLRATGKPVGLALRIGPYPGPFATNDAAAQFILNTASRLVAEAQSNQLALAELQIDFDAATAKLAGYRVWLEAIQQRVAPLPVTITALPSWLKASSFKSLARRAPNYVLQVHSVSRPKNFNAPFTLCDPAAARRAVERAARLGIPFRVALPTYGYLLAFTPDGKFLGLSAEGPRPNWPTNALLREVATDPLAQADLIRGWQTDRPAAMTGVIWYRLPTNVDNFNWRWPTLRAMLDARIPQVAVRADSRRVEPGLIELDLVNTGELDISSRLAVTVQWRHARLQAGDALRGFELVERTASTARFQTKSDFNRLRAGETRTLGWLRFDTNCEVHCELEKF